jgi:cysteine-rich repeat protein
MPGRLNILYRRARKAVIAAFLGVFIALPALAQSPDLGLGYATAIGLTTADIRTTIARIISYFLGFLGIIAVGIMLYAGFLWMTAGGSEEKISTAKKWMINGTIGLVIIMSAFAITQFVFRAITGEDGLGGSGSGGGCPPGQTCGGLGGGGFGGFKVSGISPSGPGPSSGGWPKNFGITVVFNTAVSTASITPANLEVRKCNARLDGGGDPQPFSQAACSTTVAGTLDVQSNKVIFKPSGTPGDFPTDFEGDFWYTIRAKGGAITDALGRTLLCPFLPPGPAGDISSPQAQSDLCDRAIAFNMLRDVTPPTVSVDSPSASPAYCGSLPAPVHAVASDDFLVGVVDFLIDGGTDKLLDAAGDPMSNAVNGDSSNPFVVDGTMLQVDIATMAPGEHVISATAKDGVPQSSAPAQGTFTVNPPHCCNAVKDDAEGETGIDCGGACGSCSGSSCSSNADCASGYCNPATNKCEEKPVIDSVAPSAAGPGSLITIKGRFLGGNPGTVTFLGAPGDTDDVVAQACAPDAWKDDEVVVAVPPLAVTGPLKLTTSSGASDQTDDSPAPQHGPNLGNFTVNTDVLPGICYIEPDLGTPGTEVTIHGSGFGEPAGGGTISAGAYAVTVAVGGWTSTSLKAIVPPVPEKTYPVKVTVGGKDSNTANFTVTAPSAAGLPKILEVIPDHGPVGSYVTIVGSGFGSLKGTARFKLASGNLHCVGGANNGNACTLEANCPGGTCAGDTGIGDDPICANNWKDNYVIVKVPPQYQGGLPLNFGALPGTSHKVQIVTAPPAKASNDDIIFKVTNEPVRPGLCSIDPDNGRPGKSVVISGEGFGAAGNAGPSSAPRYSVEFFKGNALKCLNNPAVACSTLGEQCAPSSNGVCAPTTVTTGDGAYSSWTTTAISTIVAGDFPVKASWPATGPVYVVADNQLSSNAVPFRIGDCNDAGASCPNGTECCASGSCQGAPNFCAPPARNSAYGWLFSTSVLPALPVVIENAQCSLTPPPAVLQSPSPYKDTTDACKNAEFRVQFNVEMQMDGGTLVSSVEVRECGSGSTAGSCDAPMNGLQFTPKDCDPLNATSCKTVTFMPPGNYNAGTSNLKDGMWYQVRLVSNPAGNAGFKESSPNGRFLDGNYDRKPGGDYIYQFRVSSSGAPCTLAQVYVDPPKDLIDQDVDAVNFWAVPTAANCNTLQCYPAQPYTLEWFTAPIFLSLEPVPAVPPNADNYVCMRPVKAKLETPSTLLTAEMTPDGSSLSKQGSSDVTVKFAEPRVIEVTPTEGCTEACINAAIEAKFNVPMKKDSLTQAGNIELVRCRNAACLPPYLDLGGTVRTVEVEPADLVIPNFPDDIKIYKHFSIQGTGDPALLLPGTFYKVRVRGDNPATTGVVEGVVSRSGVPLGGLNDGLYYSWKFRTKDDPTKCLASRSEIKPAASTLFYIGQRQDLTVGAFGSPDECSKSGQKLLADAYNWDWNFSDPTPNPVLGGFVDGNPVTPISASPIATLVNSNAVPKPQCTAQCVLRGSQNVIPQCDNGFVESAYEECDTALTPATCGPRCLLTGTIAGVCGNGSVDAGENCDKVKRCDGGTNADKACTSSVDCGGAPCADVFAPGCKEPGAHVDGFADEIGCVFLGATAANKKSECGDGFVGDGESCDDGGAGDGDGCSSECLKEGTLPTCLGGPPGMACINFCGNGKAEPGEDDHCEAGASPSAQGCDPVTCLRTGRPACVPGVTIDCCGNGVVDSGEDASCESVGSEQFCTDRCLVKGSSAFYDNPSFCSDGGFPGSAGDGEKIECEQPPDVNVDPYQVVVAVPQAGFNATTAAGSTSVVTATTTGIEPDDAGKANVALSCTCKTKAPQDQDSFCAGFSPELACASNGCCAPRPKAQILKPGDPELNVCRNAAVIVSFDQLMDHGSLAQNIIVGTDVFPATSCPDGSVKVAFGDEAVDGGKDGKTGLFQRIVRGVGDFLGFLRRMIFRAVGAAAITPPPGHTYCSVKADVSSVDVSNVTESTINVDQALPPNTWVRVLVKKDAKSTLGVSVLPENDPVPPYGVISHFQTGPDICVINSVEVVPSSFLFSTTNPPDSRQTATVRAYTSNGQLIGPTPAYDWTWFWTPQPDTTPETASVIVVSSPATVPPGSSSATADIRVRGSKKVGGGPSDDQPPGYVAHNGEAVVEGSAQVIPKLCDGGPKAGKVCADNADCAGSTCKVFPMQVYSGTADATVFLCDNPWPARRLCPTDGLLSGHNPAVLPWDPSPAAPKNTCIANSVIWYPFYDPETRTKFYYCRDGQKQGDSLPATLPDLREETVVIRPGAGVLKEFLFTFKNQSGAWKKDAIGLRIATNPKHVDILDWFRSKGFTGTPARSVVDGYDALKTERTTYVNAGAKVGTNLYTNVAVISHTDGSAPETKDIFNQILSNIEFNYQDELKDQGLCRRPIGGGQTQVIRCVTDEDCKVNASGQLVPGYGTNKCSLDKGFCTDAVGVDVPGAGTSVACNNDLTCRQDYSGNFMVNPSSEALYRPDAYCDVPKSKLVRDVKRWAHIDGYRRALITSLGGCQFPGTDMKPGTNDDTCDPAGGSYPKLDSGSFIVTMSNSTWPSWAGQLQTSAGFSGPIDPLNKHGYCTGTAGGTRDGATCWDAGAAKNYVCPAGSHVYQYQYYQDVNGTNFRLANDFEYSAAATSWAGATCIEKKTAASCALDPECTYVAGACQYKQGRVFIGLVSPATLVCYGASAGGSGTCGDGVVGVMPNLATPNPTDVIPEECEPGQAQAITCTTAGGRTGKQTQKCTNACLWEVPASGSCQGGSCGDGVVQAPETCDEGPLNGTYGHCDGQCGGAGFFCGDGKKQPSEACDCKDKNGQYFFDGILASKSKYGVDGEAACGDPAPNTASCAWDCTGTGPRCGDGLVNASETCDGGFQEAKGYCSDAAKTGCNTSADCPSGETCGNFCPEAQQKRRRECRNNDPADSGDNSGGSKACTWATWKCTAPGTCGNGTKEGAEECDDGNTNNNDGCIIDYAKNILCKTAKCGDGYVHPASAEECDEGQNNSNPCVPEYGLTCTYCTSSCKSAVKSGGYCGDNLVQGLGTVPSGPEDCDGELGLTSEYACLSEKIEHQSYGKRTGTAVCDPKTCRRTCSIPESVVCFQASSYTNNHESDSCPSGSGYWCGSITTPTSGTKTLKDSCDPDDDNDGVPPPTDCNDKNINVHPGYFYQWSSGNPPTQKEHNIPAAPEVCTPAGVDDDCNGKIDNVYILKGRILDATQAGTVGLSGAAFEIWCGGNKAAEGLSDSQGYYRLPVVADGSCNTFTIKPVSNGVACADPDDAVTKSVAGLTQCVENVIDDIVIATPKPAPGQRVIFMKWGKTGGEASDLDLHAVKSGGGCMGYSCPQGSYDNGSTPGLQWERDDTDYEGAETITLTGYQNGRKLKFFAHRYSAEPDWGQKKAEMRLFDSSCNLQKVKMSSGSVTGSHVYWNAWTITDTSNSQTISKPNQTESTFPANP